MIILSLLILGLCFGSFVNAYVWRIYKQGTSKSKRSNKKPDQYSLLHGRSMCPHCKHGLAAKDLVPVLSWLSLKGACRYCHKRIGAQYPLVELATAVLFVISYKAWPEPVSGGVWLLFGLWLCIVVSLMALAVYDLKWMLLPNRMVTPLAVLAGLYVAASILVSGNADPLVSAAWGVAIGGGLFYVLFQISDGRWIGGGDVKLGAALGLIVGGPMNAILLLFLASFIGTLVALPLMIAGKASRTSKLPFGPFLIAAAFVVTLYGERIVNQYNTLVGL